MRQKKLYPCMLCEKRYSEMEEAEVCERSHEQPSRERERFEDDGREYGHPGDFLRGLE